MYDRIQPNIYYLYLEKDKGSGSGCNLIHKLNIGVHSTFFQLLTKKCTDVTIAISSQFFPRIQISLILSKIINKYVHVIFMRFEWIFDSEFLSFKHVYKHSSSSHFKITFSQSFVTEYSAHIFLHWQLHSSTFERKEFTDITIIYKNFNFIKCFIYSGISNKHFRATYTPQIIVTLNTIHTIVIPISLGEMNRRRIYYYTILYLLYF